MPLLVEGSLTQLPLQRYPHTHGYGRWRSSSLGLEMAKTVRSKGLVFQNIAEILDETRTGSKNAVEANIARDDIRLSRRPNQSRRQQHEKCYVERVYDTPKKASKMHSFAGKANEDIFNIASNSSSKILCKSRSMPTIETKKSQCVRECVEFTEKDGSDLNNVKRREPIEIPPRPNANTKHGPVKPLRSISISKYVKLWNREKVGSSSSCNNVARSGRDVRLLEKLRNGPPIVKYPDWFDGYKSIGDGSESSYEAPSHSVVAKRKKLNVPVQQLRGILKKPREDELRKKLGDLEVRKNEREISRKSSKLRREKPTLPKKRAVLESQSPTRWDEPAMIPADGLSNYSVSGRLKSALRPLCSEEPHIKDFAVVLEDIGVEKCDLCRSPITAFTLPKKRSRYCSKTCKALLCLQTEVPSKVRRVLKPPSFDASGGNMMFIRGQLRRSCQVDQRRYDTYGAGFLFLDGIFKKGNISSKDSVGVVVGQSLKRRSRSRSQPPDRSITFSSEKSKVGDKGRANQTLQKTSELMRNESNDTVGRSSRAISQPPERLLTAEPERHDNYVVHGNLEDGKTIRTIGETLCPAPTTNKTRSVETQTVQGDNAALGVDQLQGQTPPSEAEKVCQNSNEASCSVRTVTDSPCFEVARFPSLLEYTSSNKEKPPSDELFQGRVGKHDVVASSPCSSEGIVVRNLLFDDRSGGRGIAAEDLMDESSVLLRAESAVPPPTVNMSYGNHIGVSGSHPARHEQQVIADQLQMRSFGDCRSNQQFGANLPQVLHHYQPTHRPLLRGIPKQNRPIEQGMIRNHQWPNFGNARFPFYPSHSLEQFLATCALSHDQSVSWSSDTMGHLGHLACVAGQATSSLPRGQQAWFLVNSAHRLPPSNCMSPSRMVRDFSSLPQAAFAETRHPHLPPTTAYAPYNEFNNLFQT